MSVAERTMFGGEELDKLRIQVHDLQNTLLAAERREREWSEKITRVEVERDRIHKDLMDKTQEWEDQRSLASDFRNRVDKIPVLEAQTSEAQQEARDMTIERDKALKKAAKAEESLKLANEDLAAVIQERDALADEIEPFRQLLVSMKRQTEVESTISDLLTKIRG